IIDTKTDPAKPAATERGIYIYPLIFGEALYTAICIDYRFIIIISGQVRLVAHRCCWPDHMTDGPDTAVLAKPVKHTEYGGAKTEAERDVARPVKALIKNRIYFSVLLIPFPD